MNRISSHNLILFSALIITAAAKADLIAIMPFQGDLTETWESFPTHVPKGDHLPDPTQIMAGNASISNPSMAVIEPSPLLGFSMGTSGYAQPSDGVKFMGVGGTTGIEILFNNSIFTFGAFLGAYTHPVHAQDPATISVSFFDSSDVLIGTESFPYTRAPMQDGLLEWHGWSSTTPIKRIVYSGRTMAIDGLQANLVPEPAAAILLALAAITLRARRRRRR